MERFLVRKSAPQSEVQHLVNHPKEVPLKKKSIAKRGAYKNNPSKFEPMSGPETNLTLIPGRVWQMGLTCIVSGTCV